MSEADISVLLGEIEKVKSIRTTKPRIQDLRSLFMLSELAQSLLFNEDHQTYYQFDKALGIYKPLSLSELASLLDQFLFARFGDEININSQLVKELADSIKRDWINPLKHVSEATDPSLYARSAFKDSKTLDFSTGDLNASSATLPALHAFDFNFPTKPSPTPYFDRYLAETFTHADGTPDADFADFMLTILAYYLSPLFPSDPIAVIFQGSGANGKSIFISLLQSFIGKDSYSALSMEDLSDRFSSSLLLGKRLNLVSEDQSRFIKADKLKATISLEPIKIEQKYQTPFFFKPRAKHLFSTNKDVRFDDVDFATLRRFIIIPFFRTFVSTNSPDGLMPDNKLVLERTPDLLKHLMDERPGIFYKALERMQLLHLNKFDLKAPASLKETTKQVQEFSSSALEFFHEFYEVDPSDRPLVPHADMFAQYEQWFQMRDRPQKYKLQSKQFFSVIAKNFPSTVTTEIIWSKTAKKATAAKAHLKPILYPVNGIEPEIKTEI